MTTLAERLKQAREKAGLSQQQVADMAGMKQPAYYKVEAGKTQRTTFLNEIARALKVSPDWLLTGETSTQLQAQNGQSQRQTNHQNATILPPSHFTQVPILNMVQAGLWSPVFDNNYDEYIEVPDIYGDGVFGLRIEGYSMITDFYPKDIVFIDPSIEPLTGDYVVANNEEYESTFKKYKKHYDMKTNEEWFELIPSNSEFEPIDSRIEPFHIIGVAVGKYQIFRRGRN